MGLLKPEYSDGREPVRVRWTSRQSKAVSRNSHSVLCLEVESGRDSVEYRVGKILTVGGKRNGRSSKSVPIQPLYLEQY